MYDASVGRFFAQDRFAEKYFPVSPYQYAINNPIRYIDVNGDSIWVNYGNNQRVYYDNGTLYNEDGSEYEGDNKFVSAVSKTLQRMSETEIGDEVLNSLVSSENNFIFKNEQSAAGSRSAQFIRENEGGGVIKAAVLLNNDVFEGQKIETTAHELFHGYQNDNGQWIPSTNNEVGAYLFGRAVVLTLANYGINAFGNSTTEGKTYEQAMNSLLLDKFDIRSYNIATRTFRKGSIANSRGNYNSLPDFQHIKMFQKPLISNFYPLVR